MRETMPNMMDVSGSVRLAQPRSAQGYTSASLSGSVTRRMDYLIARQGIVSSNIANATTPGYLARDLAFQSLIKKHKLRMATTRADHLKGKGGHKLLGKETVDKTHMKADGNSVQMDTEMLKLNDVQMNYRMMTRLYAKHGSMFNTVLGRGR